MTPALPELVPLGQLNPAPYNPRAIEPAELERLVVSLAGFGFVEPVVARKSDGLLVGGHQRVAALRELYRRDGLSPAAVEAAPVPVVWVELPDDQCKLLNLALNRIRGEWDYARLTDLFESVVGEVPTADIPLSGFSLAEVDSLLGSAGGEGGSAPDLSPMTPAEVDQHFASQARRFAFRFAKAADRDLCAAAVAGRGGLLGLLKVARARLQEEP